MHSERASSANFARGTPAKTDIFLGEKLIKQRYIKIMEVSAK
jgi:hypothetical protein